MSSRALAVFVAAGCLTAATPTSAVERMPSLRPRQQQEYEALGYDPKKVFDAFTRLQRAFARKDFESFVKLVAFPLRIDSSDGGPAAVVNSAQDLRPYRERIFSSHNATVVKTQKFEALSLKDEGAVVGKGEFWISGTCTDGEGKPCAYNVTLVTLVAPPSPAR